MEGGHSRICSDISSKEFWKQRNQKRYMSSMDLFKALKLSTKKISVVTKYSKAHSREANKTKFRKTILPVFTNYQENRIFSPAQKNVRVSQEFMKAVPQNEDTDQDEVVIMSPKISKIRSQDSYPKQKKKMKKSIVFQYRHIEGKLSRKPQTTSQEINGMVNHNSGIFKNITFKKESLFTKSLNKKNGIIQINNKEFFNSLSEPLNMNSNIKRTKSVMGKYKLPRVSTQVLELNPFNVYPKPKSIPDAYLNFKKKHQKFQKSRSNSQKPQSNPRFSYMFSSRQEPGRVDLLNLRKMLNHFRESRQKDISRSYHNTSSSSNFEVMDNKYAMLD
ncbi:unnamed protein product [Moneuplotes crassus]|uniref:Uncharacterized protein n=1 Tax=Euplotes crassus TaxID=5936 RepID=A0AAD1XHJ7_EUPCR|nr:unnamed protein product [Moneuplotes crassus]